MPPINSKEMKVLTIDQMHQLKELGVAVKPKGMCLMYTSDSSDDYYLKYGESTCEDDVAAFGLQDIIDLLPYEIKGFYLAIAKPNGLNNILYISDWILYNTKCDSILHSAYEMLIWVIENGYSKRNKTNSYEVQSRR